MKARFHRALALLLVLVLTLHPGRIRRAAE